jgi:hypothetical protein
MADFDDGYDSYYADRLWHLLPEVYRAQDSSDLNVTGPLQELVGRIGVQVAVVRRSIDRVWADQAIETSDDWVIPYIGDLLDTNLVNGLDPRGQRLDVAKTIHYRRRKGTVAVLEEIARDVTGWSAHIVEGFRRLSRTRHSLDPPVGPAWLSEALPTPCLGSVTPANAPDPRELLSHEGLIGTLTGTPAGGFADLRQVHGARLADSPFEEGFHTADLRMGRGAVGRYGISKLLVFLWRLQSFAVLAGTPVAVSGCPHQYVFDPTGRNVPLFLPPLRPETDDSVDTWTSAAEWQVPGPLTTSLQQAIADLGSVPPGHTPVHAPYPDAAVIPPFSAASAGSPPEPVSIEVWPEVGQFELQQTPPKGPLWVSYQYGFPATMGAGTYDRTLLGDRPATSDPELQVSGGAGLDSALASSGGAGTVTIADSLTYAAVDDVVLTAAPGGSLLVRAGPDVRPVVRLPSAANADDPPVAWVFTGGEQNPELILDGLLVSGGDIVLRGAFSTVRLTACTTDPGMLDATGAALATSVDDRPLAPVRIWIEADPGASPASPGAIEQLSVDHCVLGPIRARNGGAVETVTISDSIVQGIAVATAGESALTAADIYDPELLARALGSADPLSQTVFAALPKTAQNAVSSYHGGAVSASALARIVAGLNSIITTASIHSTSAFAGVALPADVAALLAEGSGADVATLNRALLGAGYPVALSPAAIALAQGSVSLTRVSVIGRTFVHRLQASDSLLSDFTVVEDAQDGCVRFSAASVDSSLPRQYRSVTTAANAALFTTSSFGEPGFGQLLETADRAIVAGAADVTITSGAETGSEMGAYSGQLAPIKEQGLLIKYAEYMPLGLAPVIVHVT